MMSLKYSSKVLTIIGWCAVTIEKERECVIEECPLYDCRKIKESIHWSITNCIAGNFHVEICKDNNQIIMSLFCVKY